MSNETNSPIFADLGPTFTVRCKFYVQEKAEIGYPNAGVTGAKLVLFPVTGTSEENKAFFTSTPSGKFELSTVNTTAASFFTPGKSYYIDITLAE